MRLTCSREDNDSDGQVTKIKTMLSDHNLTQLVDQPTQRRGHILDWTVVREEGSLLSHECVREYPGVSDHFAIFSSLSIASKPPPCTRVVTSRNLKAVQQDQLQSDVKCMTQAAGEQLADLDTATLVDTYNTGLSEILDRHAPLVTRRVRDRPSAPWLTEEVREARRRRRRAPVGWTSR